VHLVKKQSSLIEKVFVEKLLYKILLNLLK